MKKIIPTCTTILLAGLFFTMPATVFAQDDPAEWVLRVGGKSADIAGGVHVALEDGVVRFHKGKLGRKFVSVDAIAEAAE